jgi:hypothetical protein
MKTNKVARSFCTGSKLLIISLIIGGCKSHSNITKSVVSSSGTKTIQTINLPVFIPDTVLQREFYNALFLAGGGKYYPCKQPGCDPKFKDLYLENPRISINGNLISIKVHIAGNSHVIFLNPGISADITLTARPQVQNDTLYFRDVKLEQSSKSLLLNLTSALFKNTLEQKIQQVAAISFRPELDAITRQVKKQFPINYAGAYLLLDLKTIHLVSVSVQQSPNEGIFIDISADMETEDSSFGK